MFNGFNDLDPTDLGVRIVGLRLHILSVSTESDQEITEKDRVPPPRRLFS